MDRKSDTAAELSYLLSSHLDFTCDGPLVPYYLKLSNAPRIRSVRRRCAIRVSWFSTTSSLSNKFLTDTNSFTDSGILLSKHWYLSYRDSLALEVDDALIRLAQRTADKQSEQVADKQSEVIVVIILLHDQLLVKRECRSSGIKIEQQL
ncbi:hypothetical protein GJ496_002491 [Pomphorhynchus laevis]|nr:hypothetical protein GJ496_002491 [Pomphorhynchus laevis]